MNGYRILRQSSLWVLLGVMYKVGLNHVTGTIRIETVIR